MFGSIFHGTMQADELLLSLGLALLLGLLTAGFHVRCAQAGRSLAMTLALLPLITASVIMAVNGSLGAGIAVAGSFSMIRFRSAQGSGQEILAVFLAAALGLCLGSGYVALACLVAALYMLAFLALGALRFGSAGEAQRELKISVPEALDYETLFDDLLSGAFRSWELREVRTVELGAAYQLVYCVTLKDGGEAPSKAFLDEIRSRNGNLPVSLGRVPDRSRGM